MMRVDAEPSGLAVNDGACRMMVTVWGEGRSGLMVCVLSDNIFAAW